MTRCPVTPLLAWCSLYILLPCPHPDNGASIRKGGGADETVIQESLQREQPVPRPFYQLRRDGRIIDEPMSASELELAWNPRNSDELLGRRRTAWCCDRDRATNHSCLQTAMRRN